MVHFEKSAQTPAVLTGVGALDALKSVEDIIRAGETPRSKDFNDSVFNGRGVKSQLLIDQNRKCAYCEVTLVGDHGAVEHFRPKTGWRENDNDTLHTPGYYWLAYEWTNLLCSCDKCNSAARKGSLFPLRDPATRDILHESIANEIPLLINPTLEDPGQFIRFNQYVAVPASIDGNESDKGRRTIDVFDLNGKIPTKSAPARTDLLDARRREWQKAKALYDAYIALGMNDNAAIDGVKAVHAHPEDQFSGMFINQDIWF